MDRECTIRNVWSRLLACSFMFLVTNVDAQEIGTTLSKEGGKDTEPELRKEMGEPVKPFSLGQSVAVKWQLLTQKGYPSKIGVLLDIGPTVTLSEDVSAKITNQDPNQKKVTFTLQNGTMRVLEVSKGSGAVTTIETTDKRGKAEPQDTEYIVSCGPSEIIVDPDLCLYVSVQGRLNVTGGPAGTTVNLNSRDYTYVRQNQPPTPPLQLPNPAFLQRLLDKTTIVGTGQQPDRLIIEAKLPDSLQLPLSSWTPESPGPEKRLPLENRIPGYPIREFEFPQPPSPPSFP